MSTPTSRLLVAACTAALAFTTTTSFADITSINLGNYAVTGTYSLDLTAGPGGIVSGLEGSGITYARDRGSLFYVGDEGTGVVEISLTGHTLGAMAFSGWPVASTNHDSEGLAYLGGGVLVVGEERLQDLFRFNYVADGSVNLATADFVSISNTNVGNNGMEGISYDPRGAGSWVTVKQQSPEDILAGTLSFAPGGGAAAMAQLFNPAFLGVDSLSDVATMSPIDALVGTTAAENLLVLSLASRRLVEVNRSGTILSTFDLTNVLPHNAIEGVTVDENGTIYLVAEQVQDGTAVPGEKSKLVILSVPEPGSAVFLGLGLAGLLAFRRRSSSAAQ
jgi:uncharacterized protein YjiK